MVIAQHDSVRTAQLARVAVFIEANDEISRAGLAAQLRGRSEVLVVDTVADATVAVVLVDQIDDLAARTVRALIRAGCANVAIVAATLDNLGVLQAVEAGACALMRRSEVVPERLAHVIVSAADGHGSIPPDLLGALLSQVGKLQHDVLHPRGLLFNGFTEREVEVLALIADGFDTGEIAAKLAYSERTVKNIIHDVTSRYNLRNRCHAVAYALRSSVI